MDKTRPNILVFFTDQQRYDTCGCLGSTLGLTPNLDMLAAEGTAFQQTITCQPVCGPARAVLQTGRYATENGCFRNALSLQDDGNTLAHCMTRGGYTANYFGKWHLAGTELAPVPAGLRCGYTGAWKAADLLEFTSDAYEGYLYDENGQKLSFQGEYRSDYITGLVARFIEAYDDTRPFFTMVSYLEPHHQNTRGRYIAPEGYGARYGELPAPPDLIGCDRMYADWRTSLGEYYGCVKRLDENLGQLMDALKRKGIYENTVILFTSDHGCHFRTRNEEYKRSCHEASVHIPLVIRGGGYLGGRSIQSPVSLIDIPPTLLQIAGITPPQQMQGHALDTLLHGGSWPDEVYIQISESQVGRALRTSKWKYGVTAPQADPWWDPRGNIYVEQYFYDLEADPYELNNLVESPAYAPVRAELRLRLEQRILSAGEPAARIVPLCGE